MKTIEVRWRFGEYVWIKELKCLGRVEQVTESFKGIEYKIAYWTNGDRKDAWLPECELEETVPK